MEEINETSGEGSEPSEKKPMKDYGFTAMAIKKTVKDELDTVKLVPEETYSGLISRIVEFYKEHNKKPAK